MLQGTQIYLIMLPLLNILDTSSFSLLITHPNFFFFFYLYSKRLQPRICVVTDGFSPAALQFQGNTPRTPDPA